MDIKHKADSDAIMGAFFEVYREMDWRMHLVSHLTLAVDFHRAAGMVD